MPIRSGQEKPFFFGLSLIRTQERTAEATNSNTLDFASSTHPYYCPNPNQALEAKWHEFSALAIETLRHHAPVVTSLDPRQMLDYLYTPEIVNHKS